MRLSPLVRIAASTGVALTLVLGGAAAEAGQP
jgi:hypothetical protein